jgi:hypothetical protein
MAGLLVSSEVICIGLVMIVLFVYNLCTVGLYMESKGYLQICLAVIKTIDWVYN